MGDDVYAPIGGNLTRIGNGPNTGAQISNKQYRVKALHINVTVDVGKVSQGQIIGNVKDLSKWYKGMPSHVHLEIYQGKTRLDPTKIVPIP